MNLSLSSKHLLFLSLQRHHNKQWGTINHIYTFQLFIFIFFPTNFFREFCTASVLASSSLFYVVRKRKDRKAYVEIQHDYKKKKKKNCVPSEFKFGENSIFSIILTHFADYISPSSLSSLLALQSIALHNKHMDQ